MVFWDDAPGDRRTVSLGYRLVRGAWGNGYATEGAQALVCRAFTDLGVSEVVATTMSVNASSRRVMEKAGLRYARTVHLDWPEPLDGYEHGDLEYRISRSDWAAQAGVISRVADRQLRRVQDPGSREWAGELSGNASQPNGPVLTSLSAVCSSVGPSPNDGHSRAIPHAPQAGRRA